MTKPHDRFLQPVLEDRLKRFPVVVVTGARQVGKTTLVRALSGAARRQFITLDDLDNLDRARRSPDALVAAARDAPLTIDEVQHEPGLLRAIKLEVDRDRRPGRFLLTGSANLSLMASVGESLAGRAIYLTLRPMTEAEKRGIVGIPAWTSLMKASSIDAALAGLPDRGPLDWPRAVLEGGFPPAAFAPDATTRELWLGGYVDTYLQRDLRDYANVADLPSFLRLARLAALRTGGLLNKTDLGRDASLPLTTTQRWLSLLEASYLISLLPSFAESRSKRLIKTPKLYSTDTGLGVHLAGIDERRLETSHSAGCWLENLVLNDLLVWGDTELRRPEICFWRTASGHEVDFVVEHGRRLLPIEVKTGTKVRTDDARQLDGFCADHPGRAPFGVLLHGGDNSFRLTEATLAVPLRAVL